MKATSGFQNFFQPQHFLGSCFMWMNVYSMSDFPECSTCWTHGGCQWSYVELWRPKQKSEVFPKSPCPCNSCPSANCARSLMYIMEVFLCHFCALTFLLWRLLICYLCHYSVSSSNPWSWFVIWLETHRFAKIALLFILTVCFILSWGNFMYWCRCLK